MMCCDIAKIVTNDLEVEGTTILQNIMNYLLSMSACVMFSISAVALSNLTSALMVLSLLSTNYAKLRPFI